MRIKHLGITALALGCASLARPETVGAATIELDGRGLATPRPLMYAVETLVDHLAVDDASYFHLRSPGGAENEELRLSVAATRVVPHWEEVRVRLQLGGGLVFREDADPSVEILSGDTGRSIDGTAVAFGERVSGGHGGSNAVIFDLTLPGLGIDIGDRIVFDVTNDLAVTPRIGAYAAGITALEDPEDASGTRTAEDKPFGAWADVVELITGLDVGFANVGSATVDSVSGFRRFLGRSGTRPSVGQAWLGIVRVAAKWFPDGVPLLSAVTGERVGSGDLVAEGGVTIRVEGDLSIGAFRFFEDRFYAPRPEEICPGSRWANPGNPDRGSLVDADGELLVGASGEIPGARVGYGVGLDAQRAGSNRFYAFCVNVDLVGRASERERIPLADYTGTVLVTGSAPRARPVEVASGVIGKIRRNGTFVALPYLSASELHSQRIVVVNRGFRPALFVLGDLAAERGVRVGLSPMAEGAESAGLNVVPSRGVLSLEVADWLAVSGLEDERRAAASLSLDADPADIQVATVLTSRVDGSTDTVAYPSVSGLDL